MKSINFPCLFKYMLLWTSLTFHFTEQKIADDAIFDTDICDKICPTDIPHTMCLDIEPICEPFTMTTFEVGTQSEPLMRILVNGHNGLRNRIADRLNVPNMLELTWDKQLATMAENFLKKCPMKSMDPCTTFYETFKEDDTFAGFYKNNHSAAQIVQNVYSEKGTYYPYKFIERVVRTWYFEKEGMREPMSSVKDGITYGRLSGENNFTHFANPLIFRFGCGMASYFETYHLVCNYFPFYRTITNVLYFTSGVPGTNCPSKFPMIDEMYKSLCTADTGNFFDSSPKIFTSQKLTIMVFVFIVFSFQFCVLQNLYFG